MAKAETSFADRLGRGREMQAAMAAFSPAFAPADVALGAVAFNSFLDSLTSLNTAVATAEATWKGSVGARATMVADVKGRGLRACARVRSNATWKGYVPGVKAAAGALRGYRVPKVKGAAEGGEVVWTRPRAEQSYADLKGLLDKLIAMLTAVPGYATGAPSDLTLVSLTALSTALDTMNKTVGTNEAALAGARGARLAAYKAADTGLRAKMQSIKQATKSQYGVRSVAFRQIKGIRW